MSDFSGRLLLQRGSSEGFKRCLPKLCGHLFDGPIEQSLLIFCVPDRFILVSSKIGQHPLDV
jgi:hypothetical protein